MRTFEYRIVTSTDSDEDDETILNELGAEGWELVSVHVSEVTYVEADEEGASEDGEGGEEYVEEVVTYYLKRERGGGGA